MRSNSTKTPDRETREMPGKDDCEGVYRNARWILGFPSLKNGSNFSDYRFTHTITSLIGNALRVETQNNIEFEGILKTFSPQLEMVLEWVHQVSPFIYCDCWICSCNYQIFTLFRKSKKNHFNLNLNPKKTFLLRLIPKCPTVLIMKQWRRKWFSLSKTLWGTMLWMSTWALLQRKISKQIPKSAQTSRKFFF